MHLLQYLWSNKESPSAYASLSPSWKGRGLTMLSCSASSLWPLGPSMHSVTQHDSSLSLCWHSCALLSLFLFFLSKSFFQVTFGSMSGFHKRQKHFSVKAENDTDAHEQGGWTRQSPEVPQPLRDLLLEKNARGRAAKNGMPSSVQENFHWAQQLPACQIRKGGMEQSFQLQPGTQHV